MNIPVDLLCMLLYRNSSCYLFPFLLTVCKKWICWTIYQLRVGPCVECLCVRWVMMPLVMKKMYWCSHTARASAGFTSIYFRSNGRIMKYLWEIGGQAIDGTCLYPHPKNKNCAISRNIFQPRRRRREHDNLWTADVWIELVFVTLKEKDRHIRLECNSFI